MPAVPLPHRCPHPSGAAVVALDFNELAVNDVAKDAAVVEAHVAHRRNPLILLRCATTGLFSSFDAAAQKPAGYASRGRGCRCRFDKIATRDRSERRLHDRLLFLSIAGFDGIHKYPFLDGASYRGAVEAPNPAHVFIHLKRAAYRANNRRQQGFPASSPWGQIPISPS